MSYNRIKFAVGVFVLVLSVAIIAFSYLLLKEKGTFDKRYNYHFTTNSANFFSVGMPLKFSGFNIGVIDKISLTDKGSVFITFSVNEENKKWITQKAILVIKKPLIGSPNIEIQSNIGDKPLTVGSNLKIIISDDINDIISKLEPTVKKITNIIDSIDVVTAQTAKSDSDFSQSMKNIKIFSKHLAKSDSLLAAVTGEKNSTINLINSLNDTARIMKEIHQISQKTNLLINSFNPKIINPSSSVIKELQSIMKDVKQKLNTLDSTVKTIGDYDSDLLNLQKELSKGIRRSNQIIDRVDILMKDKKDKEVILP